MFYNNSGHTLIEVVIGTIVFVLFMAALYATLDVGLKSWQIGEVRAELQQSGEVAMKRLTGELLTSSPISIKVDPEKYIVFETPIDPVDAQFKRDMVDLGIPLWQAHVVYYSIYDPDEGHYVLYRNYKKRDSPSSLPQALSDYDISLLCQPSGSDTIKVLARNLESVRFEKSGNLIIVTFKYNKHIRSNASVAFSPGGDSTKGTEHFEIRSSVEPRN